MLPLSTITALLALLLGGGVALRLARAGDGGRVGSLRKVLSAAPSALIVAAFLTDSSGGKILVVVSATLALAFFVLAWHGASRVARRQSALSIGGLYGVITVVGLLYTFGSLLQVRLDYQRDPFGGLVDGVDGRLGEFLGSQGAPLLVLAAAIAADGAWSRWSKPHWRPPGGLPDFLAKHPLRIWWFGIALVVGACYLPLLGPATNGAHLSLFGIQWSEWARPLWVLLTAYLLARFRHYVSWRALARREPNARAFALSLFVLVVGVAVAGWLRSDNGMVLPFVFAAPVMILTLSHQERDTWLASVGYRNSLAASPLTSRAGRLLGLGLLALATAIILVGVNFTMPFTKARQEAWQDPWQFAWTIECSPAGDVPDWLSPGAGYTDQVPAGYELCIELQSEAIESGGSQTARALTVVDGGGLWGRGLSDTEAGTVPVRNSDFILASVWSKFGGLAAFLSTLLVVALWYLITRRVSTAPWEGDAQSRGDRAHIYAAGLGAMIAGQAVYVLLATTNVVMLTGVPFPFLARGGQAMGGLVLGLVLLVWLVQRTDPPPDADPTQRNTRAEARVPVVRRASLVILRSVGLWGAALASVVGLVVGIACPFASWQAGKLDAGLAHPGVQTQLRARGLAPLLTVGGNPAFVQQRGSGSWAVEDGVAAPLALHDLFGVLRTASGGTKGLLEGTVGDLLQNTIERTVEDRLSETPTPRRELHITIDPTLQAAAAEAVREPAAEGHRLPAGVVVLDAGSGAIKALSTAPDELDPTSGRATDAEVEAWYAPALANSGWGELVDGTVRKPDAELCNSEHVRCGRYRLRAVADPLQHEEYLRSYVEGDAAFALPSPEQNRATGRRYNLGSTFKVVITAAYLEAGGSIEDRIPSPNYVEVGGELIGPRCRSTTAGMITVADALRVSCNPAFIQLARDLGWDAIAPVAQKLGFTPVERAEAEEDDSLWPATAHIPASVDYQSIGTNAIGGDLVASTPFHMAAMMAAIANGGTFHDPYLVESIADDDGSTASHEEKGAVVLQPETAQQLRQALVEVTGEGGTLESVEYDKSRVRFYAKTGTHVARKESASGQYTARYFWIVGAAEHLHGNAEPIAFAVVVEGRDAQLGREQVRAVTGRILRGFAERER